MYITIGQVVEIRITCEKRELRQVGEVGEQLMSQGIHLRTLCGGPKPGKFPKVDQSKSLTVSQVKLGKAKRVKSLSALKKQLVKLTS